MEPNAYFFVNKLSGTYYTSRTGDTLEADGVPMGHSGYSNLNKLAIDLKKSINARWFETDYVLVCGLPKSEQMFISDGGRKNFRPATDKELEKLVNELKKL